MAPVFEKPYQGTGRPRVSARPILNGILWVLRTGAPWKDLLGRYPAYQTCHRRYQEWIDKEIMDEALQSLAEDLKKRGKIDVKECFIDVVFAIKKGAQVLAKLSGARGGGSWQLQALVVFRPLSIRTRLPNMK